MHSSLRALCAELSHGTQGLAQSQARGGGRWGTGAPKPYWLILHTGTLGEGTIHPLTAETPEEAKKSEALPWRPGWHISVPQRQFLELV